MELDVINMDFFSHPSSGTGRNVTVFGKYEFIKTKIDNTKTDFITFGKAPTQGLEHTLSAEKMYWINFTEHNKKIGLRFHYNGANSYIFVTGTDIHNFKAKDSEIVATPLCLENFSKNWSLDNIIEIVYDFSVDYDAMMLLLLILY